MPERQKLLMVIPAEIPSTVIIKKILIALHPDLEIKIVRQRKLNIRDIFSGEYKLLFVRLCDPALYFLIQFLIRNQINYLYYIDDNFWELKQDNPLTRYYNHPEVQKTLELFIKNANTVLCESDNLKNYVSQYNPNSIYINSGFDLSLIKNLKKNSKKKLTLTYAATGFRDGDFEFLLEPLCRIANQYMTKINFIFNGNIPDAIKKLPNVICNVKFLPYDQFIQEQFKANIDIAIVPLADTSFNRAKSNVKLREFGAMGIVGIYSKVLPYTYYVEDKVTGLLVDNHAEAWYDALKLLIEDEDLRQSIKNNSQRLAEKKYAVEAVKGEWFDYISKLPKNQRSKIGVLIKLRHRIYFQRKRIKHLLLRCRDYYQTQGMHYTIKKISEELLNFFKKSEP